MRKEQWLFVRDGPCFVPRAGGGVNTGQYWGCGAEYCGFFEPRKSRSGCGWGVPALQEPLWRCWSGLNICFLKKVIFVAKNAPMQWPQRQASICTAQKRDNLLAIYIFGSDHDMPVCKKPLFDIKVNLFSRETGSELRSERHYAKSDKREIIYYPSLDIFWAPWWH